MEWFERLNSVIDYIEEHLTDDIEYDSLARIACCSTYHFQRMFTYIANVPLSEYIRRRRMTLAAVDLHNGEKVIDVGMKFGYDSPTAFNRAFQSVHGFAPSKAKASGVTFAAFPPIRFKIAIKGDVEMNYRIEKKDAIRIIGVSAPTDKDMEKSFAVVPQMWNKAWADGTIQTLAQYIGEEPRGILGVCTSNENDEWRYFIAVANSTFTDERFDEHTIPAATWAIFSGTGTMPHAIQDLERRIVTEWLPTSGYEFANVPDIEVYMDANPTNASFEVWIPVVKK